MVAYSLRQYSLTHITVNGMAHRMDGVLGNLKLGEIELELDRELRAGQLKPKAEFVGFKPYEVDIPFQELSTILANSLYSSVPNGVIGFQVNSPAYDEESQRYISYWVRLKGLLIKIPMPNYDLPKQASFNAGVDVSRIEWKLGSVHHVKIDFDALIWEVNGVDNLASYRAALG